MSVLGLDSEYTIKYNPLPSGVPSGFALGNSFKVFCYNILYNRITLKDCVIDDVDLLTLFFQYCYYGSTHQYRVGKSVQIIPNKIKICKSREN